MYLDRNAAIIAFVVFVTYAQPRFDTSLEVGTGDVAFYVVDFFIKFADWF